LGYAVVSALQAMRPERMFAYVIFTGLLAISLNACSFSHPGNFSEGFAHGASAHA